MLSRKGGVEIVIRTDKQDCPSSAKLPKGSLWCKSTVDSIRGTWERGDVLFRRVQPCLPWFTPSSWSPPRSNEPFVAAAAQRGGAGERTLNRFASESSEVGRGEANQAPVSIAALVSEVSQPGERASVSPRRSVLLWVIRTGSVAGNP